jgi:hypothetical protein
MAVTSTSDGYRHNHHLPEEKLASTDVVEIRSDARCGVVVWAGAAIGPVG